MSDKENELETQEATAAMSEEELPAPEEGPAEAQVDLSEEDAETLMAAIGDALSDVTGLDVEVVQGGDEEMAEPEEAPAEEPAEEPEMGDEDMGDLEEALEEAEIAVDEDVSVESVVNEVTMRVAKRLLAESKKN